MGFPHGVFVRCCSVGGAPVGMFVPGFWVDDFGVISGTLFFGVGGFGMIW